MKLYESFQLSIRIVFFAFVLLSIGFIIQNKNVNMFYTFKSSIVLFIGELFTKIGEFIVMNLPLIFMLNAVCKKANNAAPIAMALVGYFTFLVTTMLFSSQNLSSQAYISGYGINSVFNLNLGNRYPLETGMIGSLLVAFATRASFVLSRNRGTYSVTNMFSKDITGMVLNVLFCFAFGIILSYVYPFIYTSIQRLIAFINADTTDPYRIAIYSIVDRVLSIFGLNNVIRTPFWFSGQENIIGGKFISQYYVINMFIVPGFYLGTFLSISDGKDRNSLIITFIGAILLSVIAGNPLPVELLMLLTSPTLFLMYLFLVGGVSYVLVSREAFINYNAVITNTAVAMPGSFPDFMINIRGEFASKTLIIFIVGLISLVLMFAFTYIYYHYIAFDFAGSGNGNELVKNIIESVGGSNNIVGARAGLFKLNIYLQNTEEIDIEKVQDIGPKKVSETRDGICFEFGTSSFAIAKRINKSLSN